MKRILIAAALFLIGNAALAMTGGPTFSVGYQMTSMTVEASKVHWQLRSAYESGSETAVSDRIGLTARYGLTPFLDVGATLGAATLNFRDLPSGYSHAEESWRLAWGGNVRIGLPAQPQKFQVVAAANYMGFQPQATTTRGSKVVSSEYMWHEVMPMLSVGMKLGPVVPYIGVGKPYLFGKRDVRVTMNGVAVPSASGKQEYTDSEQLLRPMVGVEWKFPDGYSLAVEADGNTEGYWTVSVGLAQVLR